MAKFSMYLVTAFVNLFSFSLFGQDSPLSVKPVFLTEYYTHKPVNFKENNPLPIIVIPAVRNSFYAEARYNYDQTNTSALYAGKIISPGNSPEQTLIPQIGLLYGDYKGASVQFYYQFVQPGVEINFQNQYGISFNKLSGFYFNWSDIQFPLTKYLRIGSSMQIYSDKDKSTFDFGLFLAYRPENWTFALYSFDFYNPSRHFIVIGIQRAMVLKINRKHEI